MRRWARRQIGLPATFVPLGQAQKSLAFSVWLYFKIIVGKWRALAAVLVFGVGLLGFLKFRISVALPIALAVLFVLFVAANIQLYHQVRGPTQDESLGLPMWASGALNSRGDGSHLTVILYGFPPKRPLTTEDYQLIIRAMLSAFQLDADQLDVGSSQGNLTVGFPQIPNPIFHMQIGVDHSGSIKVKNRLIPPLYIDDLMIRLDDMLRFVKSEVNHYAINPAKRHNVILSLSDWPQEGINARGIVSANRLSARPTGGYQVARDYELGKKSNMWAVTKDFAAVLLAESGYVGFQAELGRLTRKDIEG